MELAEAAARITKAPRRGRRRMVALVGPPASGKSTLSHDLAARVPGCAVVPMDGFHLDNAVLEQRGLIARKGAPDSFDLGGLAHLLARLMREDEVVFPTFDRARDCAVAGAGVVDATVDTVIVEGNYLLLDRAGWRDLSWDFSIMLATAREILHQRLTKRWRDLGLPQSKIDAKLQGNDLPNINTVLTESRPADMTLHLKG